ncbi:MAG TPA: restriction endonuclease subunit S [Candidatus Ozemobacteraceae bacterium]|nr:restriction endonuclease subunit S [Candidatus Ozemobacteraceae bacterium]
MAGKWSEIPLGEVITLQRGFDLPAHKRKPGKIPIVSSSGTSDYHSEIGVKGPGVVTGRYGTIGQVFYLNEDYWPLNTTLWVKDFHGNDPLFTSYLLRTVDFDSCSDKSSVPGVNRNDLHLIPVLRPPLAVQKAIAHILGSIDDKIELNRRMNETLEGMARALFQSWFVDFDPVRAKLDGRPPAGMDAETAALFPNHFEDTECGAIPAGWSVEPVVVAFDLTMGQSPPGDTYNENGIGLPFYQGRTDFGFRFPSHRVYCTAPTRYAKSGDTLVSVRAPVGDINMANEHCCIGRGIAAVRHKSGSTSFTYHAMASLYAEFARYEAEGTVFGSINKQNFENLQFINPPAAVIEGFERIASSFDDQIRALEHQNQTLASLRDTLLPKLLSGELRVEAVERELAEAATCKDLLHVPREGRRENSA